jgi:hypothetical protein
VRSTSPRSHVLINRCLRVATVFACSLRPLQHMGARILEASRRRCVLTKTRHAQPSTFQANQASPSSLDPATQTRQCSWCQIITPMAEVGCPAMQPCCSAAATRLRVFPLRSKSSQPADGLATNVSGETASQGWRRYRHERPQATSASVQACFFSFSWAGQVTPMRRLARSAWRARRTVCFQTNSLFLQLVV